MTALEATFAATRAEGRPAFIPFLPAGWPDAPTTTRLIQQLVENGADIIEVGFPFSDPVADGPVIQAAYTEALAMCVRVSDVFAMIRAANVSVPIVGMASYSLVHRIGPDEFLKMARASGVAGLIVPDLPLEEACEFSEASARDNIDLVLLVTPATPMQRAQRIIELSRGFVYCVSVTGITGERSDLPDELTGQLSRLRDSTEKPLCVGFGISRPEQVRGLRGVADGIIVGSALLRTLRDQGAAPMLSVAAELAAACRG